MPAAAIAGGAVVGGLLSASGAKSAAKSQERAAQQANDTQRYMYDQTRADNAPFRNTGVAANNRLSYLLGIGGSSTGSNAAPITNIIDTSQDQWRPNADLYASSPEYKKAYDQFIAAHQARYNTSPATSKGSDIGNAEQALRGYGFNLSNYNAAQKAAQTATNVNDPAYGSLLKSFDANDLANDPIYNSTIDFALDQGTQGINRQAAATGSILSGATLKALSRFGANTAATYGNDAFNRNNIEKTNTYNRLAGISGTGQQAVNTVSSAGQNTANQISNNQTALGNARGASSIAGANSFNNALSTGINGYQNQQLLNSFGSNPAYTGTGYSNADINGLSGYQGIY